jgi:hypothetical protein
VNKNINNTLQALVPILRMNGEKVKSIEAVEDWYWHKGHEYMKEVAEITYDSGYRKYADIGCDSNLTACYDVLAVIQQIKRPSTVIERIERGVYEEVAECRMSDLIDRQMAINNAYEICLDGDVFEVVQVETLMGLPSAQPEIILCRDCKHYTLKPQVNSNNCYIRHCTRSAYISSKPDDYCSWAERREE